VRKKINKKERENQNKIMGNLNEKREHIEKDQRAFSVLFVCQKIVEGKKRKLVCPVLLK